MSTTLGMSPSLIIYHGPGCLDGIGALWALHQKWPGVPSIPAQYEDEAPDVTGERHVIIVDFCYPAEVLKVMARQAGKITVIDHHASSRDTVLDLSEQRVIDGVHNLGRSGAGLAWEYAFGNNNPPALLAHIQDRDLWKFEIEGTREVCAWLYSWGGGVYGQMTDAARALQTGRGKPIVDEGRAILRDRQTLVEQVAANFRPMVIAGHKVPVAPAPYSFASDVGHFLLEQIPDAPFAGTYVDMPDGRRFSIRGRKNGIELNKVAEQYDGGGHPSAAGFAMPLGWEGDIDQGEGDEL